MENLVINFIIIFSSYNALTLKVRWNYNLATHNPAHNENLITFKG